MRGASRILVLLAFLASPFGLLSAQHALLHACEEDGGAPGRHGTPACPVCSCLGTAVVETPSPAADLPSLLFSGRVPDEEQATLVSRSGTGPARPRAPPLS